MLQLGLGHTEDVHVPTLIPNVNGIVCCSAKSYHNVLIDYKYRAWTFGNNCNGQLGVDDCNFRATPAIIENLPDIVSGAVGSYHTLLLDSEGNSWSFGKNYFGQLGLGEFITIDHEIFD